MLHKLPVQASRFTSQGHLHPIQRRTNTMLIHTRAATTGDPKDNDNNHPIVVQPRDEAPGIVGIHNGMLWNDTELWRQYKDLADERVGEVDSQLIFQVMSRQGRSALDQIEGDASIAWMHFDSPGELHVARMGGRPLHAVTTDGGSFFFASTAEALVEALSYFSVLGKITKADTAEFTEGDWVTVADGEVVETGNDFPVITIAKAYTNYGGSYGQTSRPGHRPTWYDTWDDDTWNSPRHEQQVTETAGGAMLPFAMSDSDRAIWELSMEEAAMDDGASSVPSPQPSLDADLDDEACSRFDREFFHYVTRGAFIGTDIDDETMSAFAELVYSKGNEAAVDKLLDGFCDPTIEAELHHSIAMDSINMTASAVGKD